MTAPGAGFQQMNVEALANEIEETYSEGVTRDMLISKADREIIVAALRALSIPAVTTGEPVSYRWRYRIRRGEGWSRWIPQDAETVDMFRKIQIYNLDDGLCELQPLYAAHPASGDVRAAVIEALTLARKRIEYLGSFGSDRHQKANDAEFFPPIDAAIRALANSPEQDPATAGLQSQSGINRSLSEGTPREGAKNTKGI